MTYSRIRSHDDWPPFARQREEAAGSYTPADWMQCDNHDAARSQLEASSKRDQDDVVDG